MRWWIDFHYWHPRLERPKAGWWVVEAGSREEALEKFWRRVREKGLRVLRIVGVWEFQGEWPLVVR